MFLLQKETSSFEIKLLTCPINHWNKSKFKRIHFIFIFLKTSKDFFFQSRCGVHEAALFAINPPVSQYKQLFWVTCLAYQTETGNQCNYIFIIESSFLSFTRHMNRKSWDLSWCHYLALCSRNVIHFHLLCNPIVCYLASFEKPMPHFPEQLYDCRGGEKVNKRINRTVEQKRQNSNIT